MIELLQKKYKLEIEFLGSWFKKNKTISFFYGEATLRELLEIKKALINPKEIKDWLKHFLMKKCKTNIKFKEKYFNQLNQEQINKIVEFILKTHGNGFFTKTEGKGKAFLAPSSSFTAFFLENTNETLNTFLELTWSQIDHIIEGVIWNANEQTKKGKERNKRTLRMKELNENVNIEEENKVLEIIKKRRVENAKSKIVNK